MSLASGSAFFDALYHNDLGRLATLVREFGVEDESPGVTAFRSAVTSGNLPAVRAFLDSGVSINVRDQEAGTPLLWAAESDRSDIVRELIQRDADVNAQNATGWTALFYAAIAQNVHVIERLAQA